MSYNRDAYKAYINSSKRTSKTAGSGVSTSGDSTKSGKLTLEADGEGILNIVGTGTIKLPFGTNAENTQGEKGHIRYNSETDAFQGKKLNGSWLTFGEGGGGGGGSSLWGETTNNAIYYNAGKVIIGSNIEPTEKFEVKDGKIKTHGTGSGFIGNLEADVITLGSINLQTTLDSKQPLITPSAPLPVDNISQLPIDHVIDLRVELDGKQPIIENDSLVIEHVSALRTELDSKQPLVIDNTLSISHIINLQTTLDGKQNTIGIGGLTVENIDGLQAQLDTLQLNLDLKQNAIENDSLEISNINNLQTTLDGKQSTILSTDTLNFYKLGLTGHLAGVDASFNKVQATEFIGDLTGTVSGDVTGNSATVSIISNHSINDLSDVDTSGKINGSVLKYNTTSTKWEVGTDNSGSGGIAYTDISAVTKPVASNSTLTYDNTTGLFTFVPVDISTKQNTITSTTDLVLNDISANDASFNKVEASQFIGDVTGNSATVSIISNHTINSLSDVSITAPSDGNVLKYNSSTTNWEAKPDSGGIALTDLSITTATASSTPSLVYDNTSGQFTYTPPSIPDITTKQNTITSSTDLVLNDISANDASFNKVEASDFIGSLTGNVTGNVIGDVTGTVSSISTHSIGSLSDVSITAPSNGNVLKYNSGTNNWEVGSDLTSTGGGGIAYTDLSVTTASASSTPSLSYNNTNGQFTYTPPDLSGKQNTLTTSTDITVNDISANDASFNNVEANQIGAFRMDGHIIPTSNSNYDLGSAEYKIRHLFLSNNSLWIGDDHKIDISGGELRFKKRNKNRVPQAILDAGIDVNTAVNGVETLVGKSGIENFTLDDWYKWARQSNDFITNAAGGNGDVNNITIDKIFQDDSNFIASGNDNKKNLNALRNRVITVTVKSKTTNHPYNEGSGQAYYFDDSESPIMEFIPGIRYIFDQEDSSNSGHPLRFYKNPDKSGGIYDFNIESSGSPGSANARTIIDVKENTLNKIFYQCEAHEYMGNVAYVKNSKNLRDISGTNAEFDNLKITSLDINDNAIAPEKIINLTATKINQINTNKTNINDITSEVSSLGTAVETYSESITTIESKLEKLEGIDDNANNFILEPPTSTTLGGVKSGGANISIDGTTGIISATNTTYSIGDGGLTKNNFTDALKAKLVDISDNANNYILPATSSELGGVKIGSGLSITTDGVISGKWSDGSESGEIYYTGGNVGIGTTNPQEKLHVIGNATISDTLSATVIKVGEVGHLEIERDGYDNWADAPGGSNFTGGDNNNPYIWSQRNSTGDDSFDLGGLVIQSRSNHSSAGIYFRTGVQGGYGSSPHIDMSIKQGNVGIGTDDPEAKLHIKSDIHNDFIILDRTSYSLIDKKIYMTPSNTSNNTTSLKINIGLGATQGSYTTIATFVEDGNVGIGTDNPSYKLDVNGNIRTSGNLIVDSGSGNIECKHIVYSSYIYSNSPSTASNHLKLRSNTGGNIYMDTNGDYRALTINTSQNVGIGTTNPSCRLHVHGSTSSGVTNLLELKSYQNNNTTNHGGTINFSVNSSSGYTVNHSIDNTGYKIISDSSARSIILGTGNTERLRIDGAGNVGIGTNPSKKLDVDGDINFTGTLYQNGTPFSGGGSSVWSTSGSNIYYTNGNVGIGTNSPDDKLHIQGGGLHIYTNTSGSGDNLAENANIYLDCNSANKSTNKNGIIWKTKYSGYSKKSAGIYFAPEGNYFRGGLSFYTNNYSNSSSDHEERMRIDMNGNVGIGTNPSEKLTVAGDIILKDTIKFAQDGSWNNSDDVHKIIGDSSGKKAIWWAYGNTSSNGPGSQNTGTQIRDNHSIGLFIKGTSSTDHELIMMVHNNGNVGIGLGTTTPSYKLHVSGSLYYSNGGLNGSDRRIKTNIIDVSDNQALTLLRNIPCRYYEYIDKKEMGDGNTIGFIAQEVKEQFPMAVKQHTQEIPDEYREIDISNIEIIYFDNSNNIQPNQITDGSGNKQFTEKYKLTINDLSNSDMSQNYIFYTNTEHTSRQEKTPYHNPKTFLFENPINYLFLYGKQVNDFHALDKSKLFALNFSATQEIDRQQQADKLRIAALEAEVETLKTENTDIKARLAAIEAQLGIS